MSESQGTRIVVCSKHGIPYDASRRGGCSRCIREWERQKAPDQRRSSGFPTPIKLLGLLLFVAGAYVLLTRPAANDSPTVPAAQPPAAPDDGTGKATEIEADAFVRIIEDIPDLIEDGRSDTEIFLADADDPERLRDDWDFWSADWSGRVRELTERLPARPDSQRQLKLALVYQEVSKALEELRAIPITTIDGIPDAPAVRKRFKEAEQALQQARLHFSQVNR